VVVEMSRVTVALVELIIGEFLLVVQLRLMLEQKAMLAAVLVVAVVHL
jgi:hypothetical protein